MESILNKWWCMHKLQRREQAQIARGSRSTMEQSLIQFGVAAACQFLCRCGSFHCRRPPELVATALLLSRCRCADVPATGRPLLLPLPECVRGKMASPPSNAGRDEDGRLCGGKTSRRRDDGDETDSRRRRGREVGVGARGVAALRFEGCV